MFLPHTSRPAHRARTTPARTRLAVEWLDDRVLPAGVMAVGTDAGPVATVRTFTDLDLNGTYETFAGGAQVFGAGFKGGARVAMGDFNGDGNAELVTGMGAGGGLVKIWEVNTDGSVGGLIDSLQPFGAAFTGGVFVGAGDLNGDGRAELVVSRASGGNTVKVYSDTDNDGLVFDTQTDSFNPFGAFAGGSRIALGNTNNLGGDELIVGRGTGGAATVQVYTDADLDRAVSDHPLLESFTAFTGGYTGGVFVASGPIQNAGGNGAEIIVGRGIGVSTVKIYTDSDASGTVSDNALFDSFQAFGAAFTGGVRVAAGDTDNSTFFVEVITGAGPGANRVMIRDDTGDAGALLSDNPATDNFQPYAAGYTGGVFVAFGKVSTASYNLAAPVLLPDGTTTARIFVPPGAGKIRDLNVRLAIAHSFNSDLDVTLTHVGSGISVVLFTDVGNNDDGFIINLDDSVGTDIGTAPDDANDRAVAGSFNPEGTAALIAFNGLDASSEWRLTVVDDTGAFTGTLFSWSLDFGF